jgi:NNP family nitrate/nitrite transporter-like MFS transporter
MVQPAFPLFAIAFLTAIFYLNFVARVILGPFLPVIERELLLGHGQAGSLFFYLQLGVAAGLFCSGFLAARLTHRGTISVSAMSMGVSLIAMSFTGSLGMLRASLICVGLGAGLYLPSGIAAITSLVSEGQWGRALAIHELAPNLGFITAPLIAEALLAAVSWRGVIGVLGIVAVGLGGCFWLWGQGGHTRGQAPGLATFRQILGRASLWGMALLFATGVGISLGVYTMLPLFLVDEIGLTREVANTLTGLSRVSSLGVIFLAGWLADRIGNRNALAFGLVLTGGITVLFGILQGPVLTPALVFFQSAAAVFFFPAAFAAVSHLFPAGLRNIAVSVVSITGSVVGAGVIPSGIGHLAEAASFSLAFILVGGLTLLSPLLLRLGTRPGTGHSRPSE